MAARATLLRAASLLRRNRGGTALPRTAPPPTPQIVMYEYEASPWCRRVREFLCALDLTHEVRPCPREALLQHIGPPLHAEGFMGTLSRFRPEVRARGVPLVFPFLLDRTAGASISDSGRIVQHLWKQYATSVHSDVPRPGASVAWPLAPGQRVAGATLPRYARGPGRWCAPTALDSWIDVPLLVAASACRPRAGHGLMAAPSRSPPPRRRDGRPAIVLCANEAHAPARAVREALSTLQLPYEMAPNAEGGARATEAELRGAGPGFARTLAFEDDASGYATVDADAAVEYLHERYGQGPPLSIFSSAGSGDGAEGTAAHWTERYRRQPERDGGEPIAAFRSRSAR